MSRVGKKAVAIPAGVSASIEGQVVKVKGPGGDRAARDALFDALARETGSALVHRIGNVAVLYRASEPPRIVIPDR